MTGASSYSQAHADMDHHAYEEALAYGQELLGKIPGVTMQSGRYVNSNT